MSSLPMSVMPDGLTLPPRTVLREGGAAELLAAAASFGPCGMLVHGRSLRDSGMLARILAGAPTSCRVATWQHPGGEPTLAQLEDLLAVARAHAVDWVAGVGGGSVIDIAKAAGGLLEAPLPVAEYHDGTEPPASRTPFVVAPTTAGTGSEATTVCVLTNERTGVKKSLRHASFIARHVLLDPLLTASCPPAVVAASGMDAFTQAVESLISRQATEMTSQWSMTAAVLISRGIVEAHAKAGGACLRDMLVGSYLAGLALTNARLGLVHGLAHPLGARFHQPHGLVCAVCLPDVLEFNAPACGDRLQTLERALGAEPVARTRVLLEALGVRSPFAGRSLSDVDAVVAETLASGSTAANPRDVSAGDVRALLGRLFGAA